MKRLIQAEEIREGDLLRCEWGREKASEFRAYADGTAPSLAERVYLLDRPVREPDLPEEPTVGWLTTSFEGEPAVREIGTYHRQGPEVHRISRYPDQSSEFEAYTQTVIEFVEAVAVPKAALDRLRRVLDGAFDLPSDSKKDRLGMREEAIRELFAAVDAANGDPR